MRISKTHLREKLEQLDERMLSLWILEEEKIPEDEIWEIFVVLLETRVELIKCCLSAGIQLSQNDCLPDWLQRLVENKQELRLREIRKMSFEMNLKKKISAYEVNSKGPQSTTEVET